MLAMSGLCRLNSFCAKKESIPKDHCLICFFDEDACATDIDNRDRIWQAQLGCAEVGLLAQILMWLDTFAVKTWCPTAFITKPCAVLLDGHDLSQQALGLILVNRRDLDAIKY